MSAWGFGEEGGGGDDSQLPNENGRGARCLTFSLRGVNFRFWSHIGCSGQNAII